MLIKNYIGSCLRKWEARKNQKRFGSIGSDSYIQNPLRISGGQSIFIGDHVEIHEQCWLAAVAISKEVEAKLIIGDHTVVGDFCHFYATKGITIGQKVLFANFVYVSDNIHGYKDVDLPIIQQPVVQKNEVSIGEGSWIGEHACIIGASIGKHCVVGANAVVTHNVPDYCVVVGAPAIIIKRYNPQTKQWEKTDSKGAFL